MKNLLFLLFVFSHASSANEPFLLKDISQLNWDHRIIIITDELNEKANISDFKSSKEAIEERHIVWFILSDGHVQSNFAGNISNSFVQNMQRFTKQDKNKVFLIGKDGGVKLRSSSLDLNEIFDLIDSMPMRIQEMNENQ